MFCHFPSCVLIWWGWRLEAGLSPPVKYFTDRSKADLLLWIFYVFSVLCLLCLCKRLFICALWSPAGKELISWLSFVVFYVDFPLLSYLIVSIPDLCTLLTLYTIQISQYINSVQGIYFSLFNSIFKVIRAFCT